MRTIALLRGCGGYPSGIGPDAASAVAARTAFYLLPMQLPILAGALVDVLTNNEARLYGFSIGGSPHQALTWLAVMLAAIAGAQGLTAYLSEVSGARVGKRLTVELRMRLIGAWEDASQAVHLRYGPGEILSRTLLETAAARRFLETLLIDTPSLAIRAAFPVVMLLAIDPWLALWPLVMLPAQWALARPFRRRLEEVAAEARRGNSEVTGLVKHNLDGIDTIQAYGAQSRWAQRIRSGFEEAESIEMTASRYSGLNHAIAWTLTAAGLAAAWWQGSLLVMAGSLTVGELVAFTGFVRFLNMPVRAFSRVLATHRKGVATLERLREILTACRPDASPSGAALYVSDGRVTLHEIVVPCADGRRTITATCPARRLTSVIGSCGSGKTTLLRAIAGLAPPLGGRVAIDGQDLADCTEPSIRAHVLLVPQHPEFFAGTIRDNLQLGRPDAADEDLLAACMAAGAADLIRRLSDGLSTPLEPTGVTLSSTELRRLALARALLRRPAILLLDEPASGLDPASRSQIERTLAAAARDMTVIVASQEMSEGLRPDVVLRLDPSRQPDEADPWVGPDAVGCARKGEVLWS